MSRIYWDLSGRRRSGWCRWEMGSRFWYGCWWWTVLFFPQQKRRWKKFFLIIVFCCLLIYLYIQKAITKQSEERNSWSWAKGVGMLNYNSPLSFQCFKFMVLAYEWSFPDYSCTILIMVLAYVELELLLTSFNNTRWRICFNPKVEEILLQPKSRGYNTTKCKITKYSSLNFSDFVIYLWQYYSFCLS